MGLRGALGSGVLRGLGRCGGRLPPCFSRAGGGLVLSALLAATGCEGVGEGQLSGTLFIRDCPAQDPTTPGSRDVPNPLPAFALDPHYFFGEVLFPQRPDLDPNAVDSMVIRLQRTSHKPERTDLFELSLSDLDHVLTNQAAAMARGTAGLPILPPDVGTTMAPLPTDPALSARASLKLNGTCDSPRVAPLFRGYVHFTALGRNVGDEVAADLRVTVEDGRAQREQGNPPPAPDVAGELSGSFRFRLTSGRGSFTL